MPDKPPIPKFLDELLVIETVSCGGDSGDGADEVYSDDFLKKLGGEFKFDANSDLYAKEIRDIGRRYFTEINVDWHGKENGPLRDKYRERKATIKAFREFIEAQDPVELDEDFFMAALLLREPAPQTQFPQLSDFQKTRGLPYALELKRLLAIAEKAADYWYENHAPQKGRPRNIPLENFVRRAAFIWSDLLGRPFTFDHHDGAPLTDAYNFAAALIRPLNPGIKDAQIRTAMRSVIKARRELNTGK